MLYCNKILTICLYEFARLALKRYLANCDPIVVINNWRLGNSYHRIKISLTKDEPDYFHFVLAVG